MIQIDFEGRNPIDSDFHGIKQLLSQLFLKAHINLTELTNLIINQNFIGSVIKQSDRDDEESDDDDDETDANQVFGITTVINLTEKQVSCCHIDFHFFFPPSLKLLKLFNLKRVYELILNVILILKH